MPVFRAKGIRIRKRSASVHLRASPWIPVPKRRIGKTLYNNRELNHDGSEKKETEKRIYTGRPYRQRKKDVHGTHEMVTAPGIGLKGQIEENDKYDAGRQKVMCRLGKLREA